MGKQNFNEKKLVFRVEHIIRIISVVYNSNNGRFQNLFVLDLSL